MKYIINGFFLCQNITGIQRYAYEICKELDKISKPNELSILVPKTDRYLTDFENIKIIEYGNIPSFLKETIWVQRYFGLYLLKNKLKGLSLTNTISFLCPKGTVCIHDINFKVNPHFFNYSKGLFSVFVHKLNYFYAIKTKIKIVTVSEFSKKEIERVYHIDKNRITVVHSAWQHINKISENKDIFEKYFFLKNKPFYFSMSTLAANKNFKWVLYAAKNNPDYQFAIAGGDKLRGAAEAFGFADLPNVHFLGYVSDEDAKGLMHHCKAFLFPTLYEGFGLPPLEAIASGCSQIIVSDIPVMHEIYGDYANYIDPNNYDDIDLDSLEKKKNIKGILDKYSWEKSARKLYDTIIVNE